MSEYFSFYTTTITDLATSYDIDIEQEIEYIEDFGFNIIYNTPNSIVYFHFRNDSGGVGMYRSEYIYFHDNIEDVFDFELYRNYLNFINEVNSTVSFDYQQIEDVYYNTYVDKLNGLGSKRTFYYDSIVGYIGYSIGWREYYSSSDSRAYIYFEYKALLKTQTF